MNTHVFLGGIDPRRRPQIGLLAKRRRLLGTKEIEILFPVHIAKRTLQADAGTPAISDPGFYLVREALKNEIAVECLPGATAFVPALVNSGFPTDRFCFEGFLPLKKGRQTRYKSLAAEERTIIFYESPHRLLKTLDEMAVFFGFERQISVSRELTKMFEETVRGTVTEVKTYFETHPVKGEFVICVSPL